jgi:exopolyphosphatase/guanosine-5'-triphosphate,3'-diphosphate pyrophosphatase
VKIHLIRHALAEKRSRWRDADEMRPLSAEGCRQAEALVAALADESVVRLLSSPLLRCRQTLQPLAAALRRPLELDRRLAEGADVRPALELLTSLRDGTTVVCSHGDLIPMLLDALRPRGLELERAIECEKGSIWTLELPRRGRARARYRPPSAAPATNGSRDAEPWSQRDRRIAVLDLGSTSFHLVTIDADPLGRLERVAREREMLRLGAVVAQGSFIPEETAARALQSAARLREIAEREGAEQLLPVATSALRDADNGAELAGRLGRVLGAPVRILSGEEEARIMFAAFRRRVPLDGAPALGLDLGGGSLELAIGDASEIAWEATLRLGVARLHGEFVRNDPVSADEVRAIEQRVRQLVRPLAPKVASLRPEQCIASGGTVSALARLLLAREGPQQRALNGFPLVRHKLRQVAEELLSITHDERLALPGIDARRADLLPIGAVVLAEIARLLGMERMTVCDWGLREGVALEALGMGFVERR